MSDTIDIWCNNCGFWQSKTPSDVLHTHWPPVGWVRVQLPNCHLHLCEACWEVARAVLAALPIKADPTFLRTMWTGKHEAFCVESKRA